jgi:hypothetical protein
MQFVGANHTQRSRQPTIRHKPSKVMSTVAPKRKAKSLKVNTKSKKISNNRNKESIEEVVGKDGAFVCVDVSRLI